jgi:hypothetical protein
VEYRLIGVLFYQLLFHSFGGSRQRRMPNRHLLLFLNVGLSQNLVAIRRALTPGLYTFRLVLPAGYLLTHLLVLGLLQINNLGDDWVYGLRHLVVLLLDWDLLLLNLRFINDNFIFDMFHGLNTIQLRWLLD